MNDDSPEHSAIARKLIDWYNNHKRDLPWRTEVSAYHTWLSEIILQQTRVEQGLPYFKRFIADFPQISDLASAPEEQVLKLWQGLGYYSRARNLHKAAKLVVNDFGGVFPSTYDQVIKLPGVGPYTAAAIASIAFGEEKAVVDGNVIRVISRIFGITKPVDDRSTRKFIQDLASALIEGQDPSNFNQAIMEFGALQCTPKKTDCAKCPLKDRCSAFASGLVERIPIKTKKIKRRSRFFHYLVAAGKEGTLLEQRGAEDIWGGLFQFPLIETSADDELTEQELKARLQSLGIHGELIRVNKVKKHVLSHQDLFARFYHIELTTPYQGKYLLVAGEELHTFALPRLIDRYLENYGVETGKKRL